MREFLEKNARLFDFAYSIVNIQEVQKFVDPNAFDHVENILSPQESQRYRRFKSSKRMVEFWAGRFAAKKAYSQICNRNESDLYEIHVGHKDTGAPFIEEQPELVVSISHSFDYAVALIARSPIGLDIEKIEKRPPSLVTYFCHPEEKLVYHQNSDLQRQNELLTTWWTRKEAIAKYTKLGGRMPFKKMNTIPDIYEHDDPPARIRLLSEIDGGYAMTIAV